MNSIFAGDSVRVMLLLLLKLILFAPWLPDVAAASMMLILWAVW